MFIGEYEHNLDEKGRLAIPAKFRSELQGGLVVTHGLDNCLFVYSLEAWKELAKKLATMSFTQKDKRAFNRLMFAGATDFIPDAQGRIVLPESLRKYAGLSKEAVITGVYDRLEIWNKASWEKYRADLESTGDEIAERLGEIQI
ncbi:MAG: division/cell wall cluster transcriptional repressor MraZ [Patescibacteria group bacterium]